MKLSKKWTSKKADVTFSKFIIHRDKKCVRCGSKNHLTCSHFWSRTHSATRYDPDNCIALCFPCHLFKWEHEKQGAYMDFMKNKLGEEKYVLLMQKASSIVKRSDAIETWKKYWEENGLSFLL